jgi:hypothetical protein
MRAIGHGDPDVRPVIVIVDPLATKSALNGTAQIVRRDQ